MQNFTDVINKAFEAREHAYAPYSNFYVGACVKTIDGTYYLGANVENAAYGSANCAERNAIFAAYSNGVRKDDIECLCIVTKASSITPPCGACRQVLVELLKPTTPIVLSNGEQEVVTNMQELMPMAFDSEGLK